MIMSSTDPKPILVVAHDSQTRQSLSRWLHNNGFHPIATDSLDSAASPMDSQTLLVISDIDAPQTNDLPRSNINRLTHLMRSSLLDVPVIVLADHSSRDQAVLSIQQGATDYLMKPLNPAELSAKINRAINERRLALELRRLKSERNQSQGLLENNGVRTLQSLEREAIITTLDRFNGARGKTAQALGISVRTLQRKIKEYGYPSIKPNSQTGVSS